MTSYCGRGVLAFWRWGVSIPPVHMSLIRLYITSISAVNFFLFYESPLSVTAAVICVRQLQVQCHDFFLY